MVLLQPIESCLIWFSALTFEPQVVLSADNKIVGFQPTSRMAVNFWAANPLAKELYGGKKLSPGKY